jgi:hypothetical protein
MSTAMAYKQSHLVPHYLGALYSARKLFTAARSISCTISKRFEEVVLLQNGVCLSRLVLRNSQTFQSYMFFGICLELMLDQLGNVAMVGLPGRAYMGVCSYRERVCGPSPVALLRCVCKSLSRDRRMRGCDALRRVPFARTTTHLSANLYSSRSFTTHTHERVQVPCGSSGHTSIE